MILILKTLHFILFAVKTNVLCCHKDLDALTEIVEKGLQILRCWVDSNSSFTEKLWN